MSLKRTLILFSIALMAIYCIYSYKTIVSSNQEVIELKDRINLLEKKMFLAGSPQKEDVPLKSMAKLKDGYFDIEFYSDYAFGYDEDGVEMLSKPAFGPIGKINRGAIENSDSLRIIKKESEYLTRISIEGVIPTWVLDEAKGSHSTHAEDKSMYVIEDALIKLAPENNSIAVNEFHAGKAVKVIESYDDWYFIKAYRVVDANIIYRGWIKSTALGYYDDLKSNKGIEVQIKDGFQPGWTQEFSDGLWGEIYDESEEMYSLLLYGGSGMDINKDKVEPFIILDKSLD